MDEADQELNMKVSCILERETGERRLRYHELRVRRSENSAWIEYHLLFQSGVTLDAAHKTATKIEGILSSPPDVHSYINGYLEPRETHAMDHRITR